jgi:hypothetical protein
MTPSPRPSLAQRALGLFVVGQLLFLFSANGLPLLQRLRPANTIAALRTVPTSWAELTGQPQEWSLFAPDVATESTFVAVQLDWGPDRPPVLLLSDNEPDDLRRFFRVGRFRLRRYETSLDVALTVPEGKERDDVIDSWRARIKDKVRDESGAIRVYLRWKMNAFLEAHPELPPPREVRLLARLYRIPPPGQAFDPRPSQYPLARWRPEWNDPRWLPVEAFNPVSEEYDPVRPAVQP